MALSDKLKDDLKQALKARDGVRTSALRLLLSEIKNAEIAQRKSLDDDAVVGVVGKEVKRYRESIEGFKKGNRSDLVAQEEAKLSVVAGYMPQQLSREEIITAARQTIKAIGAVQEKDKGRVMSQLMSQFRGRADGRLVSEVVTELLAGA
jgi:uncharacterized protein YqeY